MLAEIESYAEHGAGADRAGASYCGPGRGMTGRATCFGAAAQLIVRRI